MDKGKTDEGEVRMAGDRKSDYDAVQKGQDLLLQFGPRDEQRYQGLPAEIREAQRWLIWKSLPSDKPGGKPRKVPFYVDGTARGMTDTDEDRVKLATFPEALRALQGDALAAGLGFALGADRGQYWQGIDLDGVRLPTT